ncbi:hypothetical protein GGQ10_002141 [Salinibacter ruber]|uniref:type I restriction endonuclease n=1 Tax=Salinibacter ruber TaxID=146919 RepID=UPI002167E5E6|nr:type I restriction endonuclease [Salinibacter ruber]MCS4087315.1 hypothetical protein [Salinibacter ruber]
MDLTEEIDQVASRAEDQVERIESEEATKHALIIPFIKALGYDPYDLQEVIPEFTADFAEQKGEKVDYALMQDGEPAVLIECKTAGKELSIDQAAQLFRYFQVTEARFGLLTNGVKYRFFSDLEESNKMDERPFHELNLFEYNDQEVEELKSLRNSTFDLDQMIDAAHDLKYRKALREYLEEQWQNPEDEFVHWLTDKVYDGRITQNVRNQFRDIVEGALHQLVHDKVRGRLSSALQEEQASAAEELSPPEEEEEEELPEGVVRVDGEVVTLEEELEGFRIVQAILREVVDVDRVAKRDLKSYFNVLLDDTNRQPICRFHFHSKTKRIGLFDEEKNEERIQIETLDDIYDHAEHLRKTVQFYEGDE